MAVVWGDEEQDAEDAMVRDLLAACEGLVGVFDYLDHLLHGGFIPILLGIDWRERVAAGKAAIAKAKGVEG